MIPTIMIAVKDLTPGLMLSHPIITPDGKILLDRGGIINQRTIELLTIWDINYVHINSNDQVSETSLQEQFPSYSTDISVECRRFLNNYDTLVTSVANSFDFIRNQNKLPILELKDTSFTIYSSILTTGPAIMDYLLIGDHQLANEVSQHNVMVAYISGLIGRQLKMNESELQTLTLSGLLHDIGKMVIAKEGLAEPHAHVVNGGQLLRNVRGLPEEVMLSLLQHHEYLDGTGFPMGVTSHKIHPYAKIITIANIFHVETYKNDLCNPFAALTILSNDLFGKIDPIICQILIQQIRASLLHTHVMLSDGRQAEVFYFPPSNSNSPIVQTLDKEIIDLSESEDLTIHYLMNSDYMTS
ncbi:HD-GYP domain-containing protein [Pelosinus sp. sgz500959]|uniref:HD-GYP domain-containing protein n=1 Tax=Pelosinus sp. sgz500959 TaxID=3242472 RepID=UPI003671564B